MHIKPFSNQKASLILKNNSSKTPCLGINMKLVMMKSAKIETFLHN